MLTLVSRAAGVVASHGTFSSPDEAMAAAGELFGHASHWEPFGISDAGDGQPSYWLANSAGHELCILREPDEPSLALLAARHRAVYGELAGNYQERVVSHQRPVDQRVAILAPMAPGRRALDPGCGTGQGLAALSAAGMITTGCDLAPEMIAYAHATSPSSSLVCGDFLTAELGVFDLIWESALLHLYPAELAGALFARFRDLLSPHGILSVSTTASEVSSQGWEPKRDYGTAARRFRRHLTEAELAGEFASHGFAVRHILRLTDPAGRWWFAVTGEKI